MLSSLRALWKTLFYFRGYRPQPVTPFSLWKWLSQFPFSSRLGLLSLLDHVIYLSENATLCMLVTLNRGILSRLKSDGFGIKNVIYVSIDAAGSSSPVMLNLLRDAENLVRRGASLVDSKDKHRLSHLTANIGSGAIIYVDDFSGTGKQFCKNRRWIAQFIGGSFSEFLLAPVICEEAYACIEKSGVLPITGLKHTKYERPLLQESDLLSHSRKEKIVDICTQIHPRAGLGFGGLATMVVFYRNSPNTMPLVFRGSLRQSPYRGIFPRSDDLSF